VILVKELLAVCWRFNRPPAAFPETVGFRVYDGTEGCMEVSMQTRMMAQGA
jgi:hypothetical protein